MYYIITDNEPDKFKSFKLEINFGERRDIELFLRYYQSPIEDMYKHPRLGNILHHLRERLNNSQK